MTKPASWKTIVPGVLLALSLVTPAVQADSLVPIGQPAPELSLTTLEGQAVRLSELRDRPVLLLFGELYNSNSMAAAKDVAALLARPALVELKAAAYLIVTQKATAVELRAEAQKQNITLPILHDEERRVFATYRVMVLPSLVLIDGKGNTVLPCAGYPLNFQDMVADALPYAAGQLSEQEFQRRQTVTTTQAAPETQIRAGRLAMLGEQLGRRGNDELAISTYKDALAIDPDCAAARIGLGNCLLGRRELAEAETHFLHVLGTDPDSVDAALGLIQIQTVRGGGELKLAEERLRDWLRKRPNDPRVLYLAGGVAEKSGDVNTALGHYKRAAELALYGQQRLGTEK